MPLSTSIGVRRRAGVALLGALCLSVSAWPSVAWATDHDGTVVATAAGVSVLETPDTEQSCTAPRLVSAFASLGDLRDYVLAPGGSFEDKDLDGWQVERAKAAGDGSPLELSEADDNQHSLTIPAGGSATSPAMCVDLHYPTLRLMTKAKQGQGQLQLEVVYPDSDNHVFHTAASLTADGATDWQASPDMPVLPERGGTAPGMRRVALRFTSIATTQDAGDWRIDDLYVDPKRL